MSKPTLREYQALLNNRKCFDCDYPLATVPLSHYEHSDGWLVDGFDKKLWLYAICPKCRYESSLSKLYFTKPIPQELTAVS